MIAQGWNAFKNSLGIAVLFGVNLTLAAPAVAADDNTYVVSSDYLFVPQGFDDNDGVQVVLDGWVNSSCDQVLKPKVNVYPEQGVISIEVRGSTGC